MIEPEIVVDSACLIALKDIGALDLLGQIYTNLVVPEAVSKEIRNLPDWIRIVKLQNQNLATSLRFILGAGESEAIAYAVESGSQLIVLDDRKARQIAMSMHLTVIGTLRILLKAKENHLISSVRLYLDKLEQAHFFMSTELKNKVLHLAGEAI